MSKPSEDRLIAYLDGELDDAERAEIALWLERDAELRQRAAEFGESAALLRTAFDEVLHEPVPERLVAAAHGETGADAGKVVDFAAARDSRSKRVPVDRRWWIGAAAAAAVAGLAIGVGIGPDVRPPQVANNPPPNTNNPELIVDAFPDNLAGYYKRLVTVNPGDAAPFDKLPQNFPVPNLKPWGLEYQGAHFVMVEGQPANQLLYTTDDKSLGPVVIVIANSTKPDMSVQFKASGDVNVLRWRHHGHAYALAGTANTNYLWNIHNDLAYQLDGI
jgi:anti-sigma factor RsiW